MRASDPNNIPACIFSHPQHPLDDPSNYDRRHPVAAIAFQIAGLFHPQPPNPALQSPIPMKKSLQGRLVTKKRPTKSPIANPVAAYYTRLPEPSKSTLQKVRAAILSACPKGTIETISYGIPTFKHNRGIVAIAAFKNHCSLFPMSYFVIDKFRAQLSRFEVSKGTVRFPTDQPLPATLLKKIVKARLTQLAEKQKSKPTR